MKCDCCGKDEGYDIMYRTLDTRVYCWWCSKRTALCCYDKPILPTKWFRVAMSKHQLNSLEERGHTREFEQGCNPLLITRVRDGSRKEAIAPKYKARAALQLARIRIKGRKK